jgi:hypothetical protein
MQPIGGLTVTQRCPCSDRQLHVTELATQVCSVSCPCGRSQDSLRGLQLRELMTTMSEAVTLAVAGARPSGRVVRGFEIKVSLTLSAEE